jgi:hypothetical protein
MQKEANKSQKQKKYRYQPKLKKKKEKITGYLRREDQEAAKSRSSWNWSSLKKSLSCCAAITLLSNPESPGKTEKKFRLLNQTLKKKKVPVLTRAWKSTMCPGCHPKQINKA